MSVIDVAHTLAQHVQPTNISLALGAIDAVNTLFETIKLGVENFGNNPDIIEARDRIALYQQKQEDQIKGIEKIVAGMQWTVPIILGVGAALAALARDKKRG